MCVGHCNLLSLQPLSNVFMWMSVLLHPGPHRRRASENREVLLEASLTQTLTQTSSVDKIRTITIIAKNYQAYFLAHPV